MRRGASGLHLYSRNNQSRLHAGTLAARCHSCQTSGYISGSTEETTHARTMQDWSFVKTRDDYNDVRMIISTLCYTNIGFYQGTVSLTQEVQRSKARDVQFHLTEELHEQCLLPSKPQLQLESISDIIAGRLHTAASRQGESGPYADQRLMSSDDARFASNNTATNACRVSYRSDVFYDWFSKAPVAYTVLKGFEDFPRSLAA